jgi:uncharacterized membrane-anchored protein YjiN (DUF445 family)
MQGSTVMTMNIETGIAGITGGDAARLRQMKLTATCFLAVAAVGYGLTFLSATGSTGVLGFVRAGAEAAMVGGLADWFAVTALFRRPLYLPIPHTAIIPRKKDEIGAKLGDFVKVHFLTVDNVTQHLDEARIVSKLGMRLREPANADRLGVEIAHAISVGLEEVDIDSLVSLAIDLTRRDLDRRSYAPLLGELLERFVAGDVQRPLVELVTARAHGYLRENRATLRPAFERYLDDRYPFLSFFISDKRLDRIFDAVLRELEEMGRDPRHPLRVATDGMLRSLAENLQHNDVIAARIDAIARQVLANEDYQEPLRRFARDAVTSFRQMLDDEGGALAAEASTYIQKIGDRIAADRDFELQLEGWIRRLVLHIVREYGDELTVLIRRTVERRDAKSTARDIEIAVGRDLQFIRINGTVVGALAGIAIHTATVLAT